MKETFWRQIPRIVGPARASEFDQIEQKDTRQALEDFILAHSDAGTRLLDAGCNTGVEGYRLFQQGYCGSYFGLDSNPKALAYALENLSGRPHFSWPIWRRSVILIRPLISCSVRT